MLISYVNVTENQFPLLQVWMKTFISKRNFYKTNKRMKIIRLMKRGKGQILCTYKSTAFLGSKFYYD